MGLSFAETKGKEGEVLMGKVKKRALTLGRICDDTGFHLSFRKSIDLYSFWDKRFRNLPNGN